METGARTSLWKPFATLMDPRRDHLKEHRLVNILTIARCGVICGADGWSAIETFGREKGHWLRTSLALPGGIPSHGHVRRVCARPIPRSSVAATRLSTTVATTRDEGRAGCGERRTPGLERRMGKTAAANRCMAFSSSLYIASRGFSMAPSARTTAASGLDTLSRTSRSSATSPSICSDRTAPPRAAYPPNASARPSTTAIFAHASLV